MAPFYTMAIDLVIVAALIATGRSSDGSEECGVGRWRKLLAAVVAAAWIAVVTSFWLTRPAVAQALDIGRQHLGKTGELVVLEPGKWAGQRFSLAEHIDVGSQLAHGKWIVLLVHHDCDHCAAAVPKYVAAVGEPVSALNSNQQPPTTKWQPFPRLAIIEMPPFGDSTDPPPWQLPPSVLSGHLDQTRDWFATTPMAIDLRDGTIFTAKEGDDAELPDPAWRN